MCNYFVVVALLRSSPHSLSFYMMKMLLHFLVHRHLRGLKMIQMRIERKLFRQLMKLLSSTGTKVVKLGSGLDLNPTYFLYSDWHI